MANLDQTRLLRKVGMANLNPTRLLRKVLNDLSRPYLNHINIKIKVLGNAKNWTRVCWVRSKYSTSVLRSHPPCYNSLKAPKVEVSCWGTPSQLRHHRVPSFILKTSFSWMRRERRPQFILCRQDFHWKQKFEWSEKFDSWRLKDDVDCCDVVDELMSL